MARTPKPSGAVKVGKVVDPKKTDMQVVACRLVKKHAGTRFETQATGTPGKIAVSFHLKGQKCSGILCYQAYKDAQRPLDYVCSELGLAAPD